MPQVPDTTLFLFVEEEVDKRSKLYKAVKNVGKIVEFTTQTEELLTRWILTRLKKRGEEYHRFCHAAFFEQNRNGYGQY